MLRNVYADIGGEGIALFASSKWPARIPSSVTKECQGPVSCILLLPIFSSRGGRGSRSWPIVANDRDRSVGGVVNGEYFKSVPSHDGLEIRGSHHKSTDLNALNGTIRPI